MLPKFEEMILLAVLKHGSEATAGDVQVILSEALRREQSFGSVFTTLDRLTEKKFVRWRRGTSDPERGGRAPRLYTITGGGRAALIESLRSTRALAAGLSVGTVPLPDGAKG